MVKRSFSSASDAINSFISGNFEAYSSNIMSKERGVLNEPTCYSYGTHYPLIIKRYTSNGIYWLVNVSGYSVTTAKHINIALSALRNRNMITIEGYFLEPMAMENVLYHCNKLYNKMLKARKNKNNYKYQLARFYNDYENYLRVKMDVYGLDLIPLTSERIDQIVEIIKLKVEV